MVYHTVSLASWGLGWTATVNLKSCFFPLRVSIACNGSMWPILPRISTFGSFSTFSAGFGGNACSGPCVISYICLLAHYEHLHPSGVKGQNHSRTQSCRRTAV